jgi:CBS domain-containing protein
MSNETDIEVPRDDKTLAELFHLVGSLIPQKQKIKVAHRDTTVAQAIAMMRECHYSQLPVVSGKAVLGVFSYRSLAIRFLENANKLEDFTNLPVEVFLENDQFAQPSQNWESILDHLNRDDAVLVGHRDDLQGILTSLDVLNYLHGIARPFVILAVLETTLRRLIRECVDNETLKQCARDSLSNKYAQDRLPSKLEDMDFSDYTQIICHGRNWIHFCPIFGTTEYQRKDTQCRLTKIRELRNTVFHFKRVLVQADHEELAEQQEWLEVKARAFENREQTDTLEVPESVKVIPRIPWTKAAFLDEIKKHNSSAAKTVEIILDWAQRSDIYVYWGRGLSTGAFVPQVRHKKINYQLFAVWTSGSFQFYFQNHGHKAPFNSLARIKELVAKVSALPGIKLPNDADKRYVSIHLAVLQDEVVLQKLLSIYDWMINEIRSS